MGQASGSEPLGAVVHLSALRIFFFLHSIFFQLNFYFWLRWVFVATSGGYALVLVQLLIAVASLVAEYGL